MKTYQDLLDVGQGEDARMRFIVDAIDEHKSCPDYMMARDAEQYDKQRNTTIARYEKILYDTQGIAHTDPFRANHQIPSGFFKRFVNQQTQFLLGNGVTLTDPDNKAKLGKSFDRQLQKLGHDALVDGVSFGFWNLDHLDVFKLTELVPLYDENTGAMKAAVRWWQVAPDKPLRATLYELDGYTDYIKRDDEEMCVLHDKRAYVVHVAHSGIDDEQIIDRENYPTFPIIPLWGNQNRQSELVGIRQAIDCYDLIQSGFADDIDNASSIYWILQNTGGMDDIQLAKFLDRMHTVGAAVVNGDDGVSVDAHTIEVPYEAREAYLERLETDLYKNYQALDVQSLSAAEKTATEIEAAYEPVNQKSQLYEYCIGAFLEDLFDMVGIDDTPTFNRTMISNQSEYTEMIISSAPYFNDPMVVKKLPWLTPAEKEELIARQNEEDFSLTNGGNDDDLGTA